MGKHVEASGGSYVNASAGSWAGICEAGFEPIPTRPNGDEAANDPEGRRALGQRGLLTLQDLMPRRSIKAVVGGPIAFESCWKAARRHERSESAPELVSAAVAYANLGMCARNPGVAKAHLTRALHLADKAEGEIDRSALDAIRASALGSLARVEMAMGNAERSAACKRASASAGSACGLRQWTRPSIFDPTVVGGQKYDMKMRSSGPNAPAA